MALYRYTAISRAGGRVDGEMEAVARQAVLDQLHQAGHLAVHIEETEGSGRGGRWWHWRGGAPGRSQVTLLTRELAMLLAAGQTLDQALALLQGGAASRRIGEMIGRIRAAINQGKSLHEALAAQGAAFPRGYVSMVRAAEASGTLDTVLERVAEAREREERLRARVISALLYPSFLVAVAVAAVVILLVFVVPRFKQMIMAAGSEIPASAAVAIGASDWLVNNGALLAVALAAALAALAALSRGPAFRRARDRAFLRLPLAGSLLRFHMTAQFCRSLATLLDNGVDLPDALALTGGVLANRDAARAIDLAREALRKGQDFTGPLAASGLFPPTAVNVLKVGEQTGNIALGATHLARMFEEKLELAVHRLFTIAEPAIIIAVSLFVAGIIMSIISAVVSVNDLAI